MGGETFRVSLSATFFCPLMSFLLKLVLNSGVKYHRGEITVGLTVCWTQLSVCLGSESVAQDVLVRDHELQRETLLVREVKRGHVSP